MSSTFGPMYGKPYPEWSDAEIADALGRLAQATQQFPGTPHVAAYEQWAGDLAAERDRRQAEQQAGS
jgi:hypothetical protein